MANNIPQVGTRGIYKLLEPFNTSLLTNTAYLCVAVRRLDDILAAGGNPKAQYYDPFNISAEKYQQDVQAGACIVSLQAGTGSWVFVPSTYIESMPNQGGIPYTTVALAVNLSAIPDSLELSYVKDRISDVVMESLGVAATVRSIVLSPMTLISQDEHETIEAARLGRISNNTTDFAKLLQVTQERDAALEKIRQLEAYFLKQQQAVA